MCRLTIFRSSLLQNKDRKGLASTNLASPEKGTAQYYLFYTAGSSIKTNNNFKMNKIKIRRTFILSQIKGIIKDNMVRLETEQSISSLMSTFG